jgi:hypothetical protein
MTDPDVQDVAAKADDMANPAFLSASMIEERAPDIVEALNDMPADLRSRFCFICRPIAPLKSSISRDWNANQNSSH